jgi:hypothetical protein
VVVMGGEDSREGGGKRTKNGQKRVSRRQA